MKTAKNWDFEILSVIASWFSKNITAKSSALKDETVNPVLYYGHFQKNKFPDRNKEIILTGR